MGSLTCCKILQHETDGFTSPLKEIVLRIFITLKSPSFLARFKPVNLGSSGKHNNHYTTENDKYMLTFVTGHGRHLQSSHLPSLCNKSSVSATAGINILESHVGQFAIVPEFQRHPGKTPF
jgi:hypothetical protein